MLWSSKSISKAPATKNWLEVSHDTQSAQIVQCVKVYRWNFNNREGALSVFLITYIFGFTFFLQGDNFLPYTYKPKVLKNMKGIICKKSSEFSGNERISRERSPLLSGQERHKNKENGPLAKSVQRFLKNQIIKERVENKGLLPVVMNQIDLGVTETYVKQEEEK